MIKNDGDLLQQKKILNSQNPKQLVWTDGLIRKFWDYQSLTPEKYFTSMHGEQLALAIKKFLTPNASILDYACGTGALTGHLLNSGLNVTCSDLSLDSVELVNKRYHGTEGFFGAFPVENIKNIGKKFDVVLLIELIEHVDDKNLKHIFQDVKSMLSEGGLLIISTPNNEDLDGETVYCPNCECTFHRWQHLRSWSVDKMTRFLEMNKFEVINFRELNFSINKKSGVIRYYIKLIINYLFKRNNPHLIIVAKNGN